MRHRMAPARFGQIARKQRQLLSQFEVKKFDVELSGRDRPCPPLARLPRSVETVAECGRSTQEPSAAAASVPRSQCTQPSRIGMFIDRFKSRHPPTIQREERPALPGRSLAHRRLGMSLASVHSWGSHHYLPSSKTKRVANCGPNRTPKDIQQRQFQFTSS